MICFVLSRIFAIRKINPDMDDRSGRSWIFPYSFRIFLSGTSVINRAFQKARAPAFSRNFRKSIDKYRLRVYNMKQQIKVSFGSGSRTNYYHPNNNMIKSSELGYILYSIYVSFTCNISIPLYQPLYKYNKKLKSEIKIIIKIKIKFRYQFQVFFFSC